MDEVKREWKVTFTVDHKDCPKRYLFSNAPYCKLLLDGNDECAMENCPCREKE